MSTAIVYYSMLVNSEMIVYHIIKEVKDHWYKNITGFNKYNGKGKSNRSCLEKS